MSHRQQISIPEVDRSLAEAERLRQKLRIVGFYDKKDFDTFFIFLSPS